METDVFTKTEASPKAFYTEINSPLHAYLGYLCPHRRAGKDIRPSWSVSDCFILLWYYWRLPVLEQSLKRFPKNIYRGGSPLRFRCKVSKKRQVSQSFSGKNTIPTTPTKIPGCDMAQSGMWSILGERWII